MLSCQHLKRSWGILELKSNSKWVGQLKTVLTLRSTKALQQLKGNMEDAPCKLRCADLEMVGSIEVYAGIG